VSLCITFLVKLWVLWWFVRIFCTVQNKRIGLGTVKRLERCAPNVTYKTETTENKQVPTHVGMDSQLPLFLCFKLQKVDRVTSHDIKGGECDVTTSMFPGFKNY